MRVSAFRGLLLVSILAVPVHAHAKSAYREVDLASNIAGRAAHTDANLVNPWGLVRLRNGHFRIADNHSGVSTAYDPNGVKVGPTVSIPPSGSGSPSGAALNRFPNAFRISEGGRTGPSIVLFVSEDGSISGWNPDVDLTQAIRVVTRESAIYKGLALGRGEDGPLLFAANFHGGNIDVFDRNFHLEDQHGFTDPDLPKGYGPFNVQNIGGRLVVTYAKQDPDQADDVPGLGLGFVDVYDTDGRLLRRFASRGTLDAPWGVVAAPEGFGPLGGALLIGNFGDGRINAFDWRTRKFLGQLSDEHGHPIVIEGLWGLEFGPVRRGGESDDEDAEDRDDHKRDDGAQALYFAAGIHGESDGLFGLLRVVRGKEERADDDRFTPSGVSPSAAGDAEFRVTTVGSSPIHLSDGIPFQVSLNRPGMVRLGIFDAAGRLVAEPIQDQEMVGTTVVRWDGVDSRGSRVTPGAYLYRANIGPRASVGRMVIIR